MDTIDTVGQHHDSHHIYSQQCVSFFCMCDPFVFQHEQTCWRIVRYISQGETKASSLRSSDREEIRMKSWRRIQA